MRAQQVQRSVRRHKLEERAVVWTLRLAALISVATTVAIVVTLIRESIPFFEAVSIWDFLSGTKWTPKFRPQNFGVLPLVAGTLLIALIASGTAVLLGLSSAIFLSEYAPDRVRRIIKPILEVLAGIPTVVYGFFALSFVTPQLQKVFPDMIIFNALSAGLVMGLMIMPMISTLSEDAMVAVPRSLRDAAYALGATKFEVATKVVVPAALGGIVASFILALSRAIGETMIVTLAAGATPNLTFNPIESVQAMTAYIVQATLGEAPHGTIEFQTIFAVGMLLFVMTLVMNILGRVVVSKYREKYE